LPISLDISVGFRDRAITAFLFVQTQHQSDQDAQYQDGEIGREIKRERERERVQERVQERERERRAEGGKQVLIVGEIGVEAKVSEIIKAVLEKLWKLCLR